MSWKKGLIIFLKVVVILIGIIGLVICLFGFPILASRDVAKHPDTAYLQYCFLGYVYVLCIPFNVALYQAFKLLTLIDVHQVYSKASVRALQYIKYCAMTVSILIVLGIGISMALFYGNEDITGIIMLAFLSILTSIVIATVAAVFQRLIKKAVAIKSENDLLI